jgi:hypothetical protein
MSKLQIPFVAEDVSALARSLAGQVTAHGGSPGHVEWLNILAKASGYRNFQHFRAQFEAREKLEAPPAPPPPPVDMVRLGRIVRYFDAEGRLTRWPGKASHRPDCLWVMWSRMPAGTVMHEREVNTRLAAEHHFGDHALLRREMVDGGLMRRTIDGREYRRIEQAPPASARELIRILARRTDRRSA